MLAKISARMKAAKLENEEEETKVSETRRNEGHKEREDEPLVGPVVSMTGEHIDISSEQEIKDDQRRLEESRDEQGRRD